MYNLSPYRIMKLVKAELEDLMKKYDIKKENLKKAFPPDVFPKIISLFEEGRFTKKEFIEFMRDMAVKYHDSERV